MHDNFAASAPGSLKLRGQLADLARVAPWVEALARQYSIPPRTSFAINLCLEEALSNIVRHGYKGDASKEITVAFQRGEGGLALVIEDAAPHFRPLDPDAPEPPTPAAPLEEITPGGQGVRLIRKFADSVTWEPLERGNRLTLRFAAPLTR